MRKITLSRIIFKITQLPQIAFRNILRRIFKFPPWHTGTLSSKVYALKIIDFCNRSNSNFNTVIEIGCGLGDIIRNIKGNKKIGYDLNENVLNAARFLARLKTISKKTVFMKFDFLKDSLNGHFDIIIMVNWLHGISPELLKPIIKKYFNENLNENGQILIDTVEHKNYLYNHNIQDLTMDLPCSYRKIHEEYLNYWGGGNRCIYCITKLNKGMVL